MGKLYKLLISLLIMGIVLIPAASSLASESAVLKTRKEIGVTFKDAVRDLKIDVDDNDEHISTNNDDIVAIEASVTDIKNASELPELNFTVLEHGKANLDTCRSQLSSYTNEFTCASENDLKWTGTKWKWTKPAALSDCSPALGEVKVSDGAGGFTCVQQGSYAEQSDGYGPCNNSIGQKYSKSKCMFTNSATNKTYQVSDSKCSTSLPSTSAICGYGWVFVGYGSCQSNNLQYGTYQCKSRVTGAVVSGSNCSGSEPSSSRVCSGSWTTSAWSACGGASCGQTGSQTRTVSCSSPSACNPSTQPATSQSCTMSACAGSWIIGSWSSCSGGICGSLGSQTRSVTCSNGNCLTVQPATSQSCTMAPCGSWQVSSWGACSKTCGGGSQTRSVSCPSGNCSSSNKPATSQSCNTQACVGTWVTGSWGSCSKTCGTGTQSRSVSCDGGNCPSSSKPATSQSCNTQACGPDCAAKVIDKSRNGNTCSFKLPEKNNGSTVTISGSALCHMTNSGDGQCSGTFKCNNNVWVEDSWMVECSPSSDCINPTGDSGDIRTVITGYQCENGKWTCSDYTAAKTTYKCKVNGWKATQTTPATSCFAEQSCH